MTSAAFAANDPYDGENLPETFAELDAQDQVLELRNLGWPYRKIAEAVGCSVAVAHKRYRQAITRLCPPETHEQIRSRDLDQLDVVSTKLLSALMATPDTKAVSVAQLASAFTTVQARRHKLIGLELSPSVHEAAAAEADVNRAIADLVRELGETPTPDDDDLVELDELA